MYLHSKSRGYVYFCHFLLFKRIYPVMIIKMRIDERNKWRHVIPSNGCILFHDDSLKLFDQCLRLYSLSVLFQLYQFKSKWLRSLEGGSGRLLLTSK